MTDDAPRPRIYLGSYEGGLHHLVVPREVLRRADEAFAAEREREAEKAKLAALQLAKAKLTTLQSAKAHRKLLKLMRAMFGRGRRP